MNEQSIPRSLLGGLLFNTSETGVKKSFLKNDILIPYISKNKAYKRYGRTSVDRWIKGKLIQPRKGGGLSNEWIIDRREIESVANSKQRSGKLVHDQVRLVDTITDLKVPVYLQQALLSDAADLGATRALIMIGALTPYLTRQEAYREYGKHMVSEWIKEGLIRRTKDSDWKIDRVVIESLFKAYSNPSYNGVKYKSYPEI